MLFMTKQLPRLVLPLFVTLAGQAVAQGADRDCSDFTNQREAQSFFDAAGPGDPHRLDADDDGVACEPLR
jgi:hypothetical protein